MRRIHPSGAFKIQHLNTFYLLAKQHKLHHTIRRRLPHYRLSERSKTK